ncbi:MAG: PKD repeat protein, partial [Parvicella sp.]
MAFVLKSQCPTVDFSINGEVCLYEGLTIANSSVNSAGYEWDFCSGYLSNAGSLQYDETIGLLNNAFGMDVVYEGGEYYTFIVNRADAKILRLTHGTTVDGEYTVKDLVVSGDGFTSPQSISLFKEGEIWYGLMSTNSGEFYRLTFTGGLSGSISASSLGVFDSKTNFGEIEIIADNDSLYAISVGATDKLLVLNFSQSITSTPADTVFTISGGNPLYGVSLVQTCSGWEGLLTGFNSGVHKVEFSNFWTSPTVTGVTTGISNPRGVDLIEDGGNYYGLLVSQSASKAYKLEFGTDLVTTTPGVVDLTNYGVISTPIATDYIIEGGDAYLFTAGFNNDKLQVIDFERSCDIPITTSEVPTGINYSTSGTYTVSLRGYTTSGAMTSSTQSLTVTADTAPSISFISGDNQCIGSSTSFEATPSIGLTYSWDFNGEGASSDAVTSFTFNSIGEKIVTLAVSDGTCSNAVKDTVAMYELPAAANYDYTVSALCTNAEFQFTNTTAATGLEGVIGYSWDFNGEGTSTLEDPTYTFSTPGSKTVSLEAYLPGCTTTVYSEVLEVISGPEVSFSYQGNCGSGQELQFTNTTTGIGITGYTWDFGDGQTSILENPQVTYASVGSYDVSLTVTNSSGCSTVNVQNVTVSDDPRVDFSYGASEENVAIVFTGIDNSPTGDAIATWSWDFGGLESSSIQNPSYAFTSPGDYQVVLTVSTTQGCSEAVSKTVTVEPATCPTLSYDLDASLCIGEGLTITNSSVNSASYEWDFCSGYLSNAGSLQYDETIGLLNNAFGMDVVYEGGEYYTFIVNRADAKILRLTHGTIVDGEYAISDLVVSGDGFTSPQSISLFKEGEIWYGLMSTNSGEFY